MSWTRGVIRGGGVGLLAMALAAATAAHQGEAYVTASGARIRLEPVDRLSCDQLRDKLHEIDETDYRGLSPLPRDPRDRRLLSYETEVSMRYYSECARRGEGQDAAEVLRRGFDPSR